MTITWSEAEHIMDAMAMMYVRCAYYNTKVIPDVNKVQNIVRSTFLDFCDNNGIEEVEDPDEIVLAGHENDDVDETNYDPYIGGDVYETDPLDDWL